MVKNNKFVFEIVELVFEIVDLFLRSALTIVVSIAGCNNLGAHNRSKFFRARLRGGFSSESDGSGVGSSEGEDGLYLHFYLLKFFVFIIIF